MNHKKDYYLLKVILISIFLIVLTPILFGFIGTTITSLGYFPNIKNKIDLSYFYSLLALPGLHKSMFLTIFVGFVSTFLSLLISQLILLKVYNSKFYSLIKKCLVPLIAFPHVTMAVGVSFLFSSSGFFTRLNSYFFFQFDRPPNSNLFPDDFGFFLILGLVLKEVPFFLLMSISFLSQFRSKQFFHLGKTLNHNSLGTWFFFIFPQIYKRLKLSIIVVLIFSSSVIDMAYILAPTTPSTLSIRVLELLIKPELENLSLASCVSLLQFGLIMILVIFWYFLEMLTKNLKFVLLTFFPRENSFVENILFILSTLIMLLSILCIFISLLWALSEFWYFPELLPQKFTFNNFLNFALNSYYSLANTIFIAVSVSVLCCLTILLWLEITYLINFNNKFLELFFFIPLLIPELSFLIGINYFLVSSKIIGSYVSLIFIEMLYVLPYTYLIIEPSFRKINYSYIHLAKTFQKSNFEIFFKIRLPLITRAIFLSFSVGVLISIGLYTPVYFIGDGQISTLSTDIINLSFSGSRKDLGVSTVIQMALPTLVLILFFFISKRFIKWQY